MAVSFSYQKGEKGVEEERVVVVGDQFWWQTYFI